MTDEIHVRRARHDDYESVVAFTEDTWAERDDYLPEVFHHWVDADGPDRRTFVAVDGDSNGDVVGIVQAVRLSAYEAWYQGLRVHPEHRGRGIAATLDQACVDWSRDWGATVGRLMVFSWNVGGLATARASGYDPVTEFRWMHPEPDPEATPLGRIVEDPDVAYAYWTDSDARDHLGGLALDDEESWACSELTRETLHRAADETRVFAVLGGDDGPGHGGRRGTRGMTYRVRDYERETDDGTERRVEYGVAAWDDQKTLRDLLAAVARDAGELEADHVRVLIPETARHVSDAASAGAGIADEPDFVLARDLA